MSRNGAAAFGVTGSLLATQTLPVYVPGAMPAALTLTRTARDSSGATLPAAGVTEVLPGAPQGTGPSTCIANPLNVVAGAQAPAPEGAMLLVIKPPLPSLEANHRHR